MIRGSVLYLSLLLLQTSGCIALVPLIEPDKPPGLGSGTPTTEATYRPRRRRVRDPIPKLIRQLEKGDAAERTRAATSLGEYPSRRDETVPYLIQATTYDSSKNVRRAALKALAALKDPRGIPAIRARLKDPDPFVRESARNALKKLLKAG